MIIYDQAIAEKLGLERRCGYWEVNGAYFFDKSECLRYATKHKQKGVRYHFYDSVYKTLSWAQEPATDIQQMYRERAEQLRAKYDYLILSFSGGADSTNILKTFVDNNIKLDEVYCEYPIEPLERLRHRFSGDRNDSTLLTYEWFTAAKPALEHLAATKPDIRITVDDVSEDTVKIVENTGVHKLLRGGSSVNPNTMKYYRLYEIARDRERHGRVACITGLDKPRITQDIKTGTFFSRYSDFNNIFSDFPDHAFNGYQAAVEFFYYAHDYPALNQKQCFLLKHAVKQAIETHGIESDFYQSLLGGVAHNRMHVYDVHHDYFKKTLYPFWNVNTWQAKKTTNFFYFPGAQWFYDTDLTSDRVKDFYDKQLLELLCDIDPQFILYENNKPAMLVPYFSAPIPF